MGKWQIRNLAFFFVLVTISLFISADVKADQFFNIEFNGDKAVYFDKSEGEDKLKDVHAADSPTPAVPVEAASNFDRSGIIPDLVCSRLDFQESEFLDIRVGVGNLCSIYVIETESFTQEEELLCEIGENPYDTDKVVSATWDYIGDTTPPSNAKITSTKEDPASILLLYVCENGSYAFSGPISLNQNSPCDFCKPEPVPTVTEWGLIFMSLLLVLSAVWFIHRRKQTS